MQVIRMGIVVWKVDFFFIFGVVIETGPKVEVPRKHLQVGAPNLKSIAPNSTNCALTKCLEKKKNPSIVCLESLGLLFDRNL